VARHNRTLNLLGERGETTLRRIQELKWGFIGAGGVMSAFLNTFKFLGPKQCVIVEGDRIERSNANRLFGYRAGDDGKPKVEVARRELLAFDPTMEVEGIDTFLPSETAWNALKGCDLLVCGPDNDFCRYLVAEFASRYWKIVLDFGSGVRLNQQTGLPAKIGGQARLQFPTPEGKCLACLGLEAKNLINPKLQETIRQSGLAIGYIQDSDLPTPASVVTINAVVATVGVRMLLSYLSGVGKTPAYLEYDELELQFREFSTVFKKRPDCPICGDGDSSVYGWGDKLPAALQVISPTADQRFDEPAITARVSQDGQQPEEV
jgi:molybdopterin/thiamine biosynthesis adenylyltransferase